MKKLIATLLVASMAMGLVACGNSSKDEKTATPAASTIDTDTTTLRVSIASEPDKIDPALSTSVDGATLIVNSFAGLYTYDENSNAVPAIADGEAEVSEDGLTYTIKMKETVWSNGEPLTANDFVYSWNRVVAPETAADYAYMFTPIDGFAEGKLNVTALDDYTLQVVLTAPCPYFKDLLAFQTYFPVYQADVEAADPDGTNPGAWCQEPGFVSNGAFTLKEWNHDESMVYEKNPNFYRADEVKLEKLEYMLSADHTAMYAAYNAGNLDLVDEIPSDEISSLDGNPEYIIQKNLGTYYVGFNVNSPIFDGLDAKQAAEMRQALSLLIDRQYIVDTVEATDKSPAGSYIPEGMSDGNGGVFEKDANTYYDATATGAANAEEAMKLLEDCGYSFTDNGDGSYAISPALSVTYLINESTTHSGVAQCIQQDWGVVGIDVKIEVEDWNVFLEDRKAGKFDIAREGWIADFNDPINMLEMWLPQSGNNDMQFGRNPENKATPDWTEYVDLINEIYVTTDLTKRTEMMHKAEDILMSTYAVVPVYFYNDIYLQKSNVTGIYETVNNNKFFMYAEKKAE